MLVFYFSVVQFCFFLLRNLQSSLYIHFIVNEKLFFDGFCCTLYVLLYEILPVRNTFDLHN